MPIANAEAFCTAVRAVGSRCDLVRYEGQPHDFAGYDRNRAAYDDTIAKAEVFLRSLHLMQ